MDNLGYQFLIDAGVLAQIHGFDAAGGPQVVSTVYAVRLGDAQIVTVPGELFPEVYYGVAKARREDCSKAATGRPPEPPVREFMTAEYNLCSVCLLTNWATSCPGTIFLPPASILRQGSRNPKMPVPPYPIITTKPTRPAQYWPCLGLHRCRVTGRTAAKFPACASQRNSSDSLGKQCRSESDFTDGEPREGECSESIIAQKEPTS